MEKDSIEGSALLAGGHPYLVEAGRNPHPIRAGLEAVGVDEEVLVAVEIGHLEGAEVNRIGSARPAGAKRPRVVECEPEGAPAARGVSAQDARARRVDQRVAALEGRDQLLHQMGT